MGGRDHSCEGCGKGGFNNDLECECPVQMWQIRVEGYINVTTEEIQEYIDGEVTLVRAMANFLGFSGLGITEAENLGPKRNN